MPVFDPVLKNRLNPSWRQVLITRGSVSRRDTYSKCHVSLRDTHDKCYTLRRTNEVDLTICGTESREAKTETRSLCAAQMATERGSEQPQLMVFIAVSVCDVGYWLQRRLDTPKNTPRAGWLENPVQQNQVVVMANFRHVQRIRTRIQP
jgi:hypothetical protein